MKEIARVAEQVPVKSSVFSKAIFGLSASFLSIGSMMFTENIVGVAISATLFVGAYVMGKYCEARNVREAISAYRFSANQKQAEIIEKGRINQRFYIGQVFENREKAQLATREARAETNAICKSLILHQTVRVGEGNKSIEYKGKKVVVVENVSDTQLFEESFRHAFNTDADSYETVLDKVFHLRQQKIEAQHEADRKRLSERKSISPRDYEHLSREINLDQTQLALEKLDF